MNRNQRRLGRILPKRKESEDKVKAVKKNGSEIEEVLPPKTKKNPFKTDKPMTNRCCYFSPDQKDFGQLTEMASKDKYQKILMEQYSVDPIVPDTISQLNELRKILCGSTHKVENCSQYVNLDTALLPAHTETSDGSHWQNIESADEIDKYINEEKVEVKLNPHISLTKNVHISEVPRVRVIAEKFSKLKKANVELRKLDEKVVCLEYDVYDEARNLNLEHPVPAQKMRAFFSIKPINIDKMDDVNEKDSPVAKLPIDIKNEFHITEEDLKELNEKQVEIIDGKIKENKSYLEDLRRVLRRKQAIYAKKQRASLDLLSLYERAKNEGNDFSNTNLLSKAELQEIKNLILNNDSSIHGINRRKVKLSDNENVNIEKFKILDAISESIVNEVMRETGSLNKI